MEEPFGPYVEPNFRAADGWFIYTPESEKARYDAEKAIKAARPLPVGNGKKKKKSNKRKKYREKDDTRAAKRTRCDEGRGGDGDEPDQDLHKDEERVVITIGAVGTSPSS